MESAKTEAGAAAAILLLGCALTFGGKILVNDQDALSADSGLTSLVGLGVTTFGTLILIWWGLGFFLAVAAELLVQRGRINAARRIGVFAPSFMRRAACLALGVNLIAVPSAHAAAALAAPTSAAQQIGTADEASALSPQWVPDESLQILKPDWRPTAPPPDGSLLVKEPREDRDSSGTRQAEVVVQPGDSLWAIAARHLGPATSDAKVAEVWPQWYTANRAVIGENPELLQPGQLLHPPSGTPTASK